MQSQMLFSLLPRFYTQCKLCLVIILAAFISPRTVVHYSIHKLSWQHILSPVDVIAPCRAQQMHSFNLSIYVLLTPGLLTWHAITLHKNASKSEYITFNFYSSPFCHSRAINNSVIHLVSHHYCIYNLSGSLLPVILQLSYLSFWMI